MFPQLNQLTRPGRTEKIINNKKKDKSKLICYKHKSSIYKSWKGYTHTHTTTAMYSYSQLKPTNTHPDSHPSETQWQTEKHGKGFLFNLLLHFYIFYPSYVPPN